jgi:hypothetical protein
MLSLSRSRICLLAKRPPHPGGHLAARVTA